jgi:two-component system, OmpR family, phosphate regulon response regulator PhoB
MADTILVVDDEQDSVDLIAYNLQKAGYKTLTANDGLAALDRARDNLPALILLDLMLPHMEGTEVCKQLKADSKTAQIPVIMLTAKADEVDRVVGLELGADDYITKPFSPRELLLRIKLILRRMKGYPDSPEVLKHEDLVVDTAKHLVLVKSREVEITATEFKLLLTLMQRRGRVQPRERLLTDVWDYTADTDTRTVDTYVSRLRVKLGKAGDYIETVRGVGYRFIE